MPISRSDGRIFLSCRIVPVSHTPEAETFCGTRFFIRNHFISNPVLDSQKFKRLLELQGKSGATLGPAYMK